MTRYVRNDGGTVHSVPDDFELPDKWEEVTEADASPALLGNPDPAVTAVEIHDGPAVVVDTSGPAVEPGDQPEPPADQPEAEVQA